MNQHFSDCATIHRRFSCVFLPTSILALALGLEAPAAGFFDGVMDEARVFTFAAGQFSTSNLLLNRAATERAVAPVKFHRLVKL